MKKHDKKNKINIAKLFIFQRKSGLPTATFTLKE